MTSNPDHNKGLERYTLTSTVTSNLTSKVTQYYIDYIERSP